MTDEVTNERPLSLLDEVLGGLRTVGIRPILIGGMAVHFQVEDHIGSFEELDEPVMYSMSSPRRLAALHRATADVDIVVLEGELDDARSALEARGFVPRQQADGWVRMATGRDHVDLIGRPAEPRRPSVRGGIVQLGVAVTYLDATSTSRERTPPGCRIASPASLVVLKAIAWTERREQRDLADLATLALVDVDGRIADELIERRADYGRSMNAVLRHVAAMFDNPHGVGPSAFIEHHRDGFVGVLRSDADSEDPIRAAVSDAVRKLFHGM